MTVLEDRSTPAFLGGVSVAVGDVNGDGFPDIIAGQASNGSPLVRVISGKDGTEVVSFLAYDASFTGGVNVTAGDVDGDGVSEVITGTGAGGGPHVRVFDGATGTERFSFFPYENTFRGGVIVAAADVTGDRKAEIITGTGVGGGPRVQVTDAATQKPIADFFAYEDTFRGGVLVGAGDIDGDRVAEVISGTGVGGGPRVQVFKPLTGQALLNFFAYEDSFRGGVQVGAGDADGDGRDEVLTGTGPGGGPVVTSFDAASGAPEARFAAFDSDFRGGVGVAGADVTGDGKAEIVTATGPGRDALVSIFTGDASKAVVTFSPFDPVQLPGQAINARTPNPAETAGPPTGAGLTVSQSRAVVGTDQQLVFTARAEGADRPTRVELFQSDAAGNAGAFLLDLFDDGSFTHRDATAGDGVFSNSITVHYANPGGQFYLARVTVGGKAVTYPAQVAAVAPPSADMLTMRNGQLAQMQGRLDSLVAQTMSVPAALAQVAAELKASPDTVRVDSISMSGRGVYWETPEGIPEGVLATVGSGAERAGFETTAGEAGGGGVAADEAAATCKGRALVLAPYFHQFEGFHIGPIGFNNDESDDIAQQLKDKGYDVQERYNRNATDQNISIDNFKDLGQYDVVIVSTHGDQGSTSSAALTPGKTATTVRTDTPVLLTGQAVSTQTDLDHYDDLQAGRVVKVGNTYALTPAFFAYYSGQMGGTVVYFGACRSARDSSPDPTAVSTSSAPEFAQTFIDQGAGAYIGYSDYVGTRFAANHGRETFEHLLGDGTFNTIPDVGDTEFFGDHARFRVITPPGGGDSKLSPKCDLLRDYDLQVTYSWPASQKDLDTGTTFLGGSVGFDCPGSPYVRFSGDDTSTGGTEVATVNLYQAFRDGKWQSSVPVALKAGWYAPSKGAGSATVFVVLKHKTTGAERGAVQMSISPGSQDGCAETVVGTVTVTAAGIETQERVSFTLA